MNAFEDNVQILDDNSEEARLGAEIEELLDGQKTAVIFNTLLSFITNQLADFVEAGEDIDDLMQRTASLMKEAVEKTIEFRESSGSRIQ